MQSFPFGKALHLITMNLPGLKLRPRRGGVSPEPDDYSKWGWYVMAAMAVVWILYSLIYGK